MADERADGVTEEHGPEHEISGGDTLNDPATDSQAVEGSVNSNVQGEPEKGSEKGITTMRIKETKKEQKAGMGSGTRIMYRVRELAEGEAVPVGAEETQEPVCDWQEQK